MLTDIERKRYQRHLQLPGFGEYGQRALKDATVCIVGLGGLGSPAGLYLASAGVGRLVLVDGDTVSLSNLQRQVLFTEGDLGRNKAIAASARSIASASVRAPSSDSSRRQARAPGLPWKSPNICRTT